MPDASVMQAARSHRARTRVALLLSTLSIAWGLLAAANARGDVGPGPSAAHVFAPIFPFVEGGEPVPESAWPATLLFNDQCTATAIGPRVLLTAAHCVSGLTDPIDITLGGAGFRARCRRSREYLPYESARLADFALCVLEEDLRLVLYETVDLDDALPALNDRLFLVGWGCPFAGFHPIHPSLRGGFADVVSLPEVPDSYRMDTHGGAAVCNGDSGGAVYDVDPARPWRRVAVGVAAQRHNWLPLRSLNVVTSRRGFRSFVREFAARFRVAICGLTPSPPNCRAR